MSSFNSTVGRSSSRKKEQSSSIEPFPLYHNHLPRPRSESRSSRTISPLPKLESRSSRNSSPLLKPEPRSVDTLAPFRTPSPSWLVRQAYPPVYIPKRDPMVRESGETKWPSGVLSGGRIIDMMESLSSTGKVNDYALVLWLQEHYVVPFGRIERLDGLVVTDKEDLELLHLAHEFWVDTQGERAWVQRLWVPGLEPTHLTYYNGTKAIPKLPKNIEHKKWRGSNMYFKNGIEVKRKGRFNCKWTDELKWERTIWSVPRPKIKQEHEGHVNILVKVVKVEPDTVEEESVKQVTDPSAATAATAATATEGA